jgi:hypothetical protein
LPLRLVLARTDDVAVAVVGGTAYSTGVELRLAVRRQPKKYSELDDDDMDAFFEGDSFEPPFGHPHRRMRRGSELSPEILRFGVQFSDGRKVTTVGGVFPWDYGADEDDEKEPPEPVLMPGRGGGGNGNWEFEFWLWPMPPPGPLVFVVEWPAKNIELTRHEVDAALFREAAAKSEVLWPDAGGAPRITGSYGIDQIISSEHGSSENEKPPPDAHLSDH